MSPTIGNPPVVGVNRFNYSPENHVAISVSNFGGGFGKPSAPDTAQESDCYEVMQDQARHSHSVILFVKHNLQP